VTIGKSLCGQKISISFARAYDKSFTKEEFSGGVYMFDIGKIQTVTIKYNDGVLEYFFFMIRLLLYQYH